MDAPLTVLLSAMTRELRPLARALSLRPAGLPGVHRSWQGSRHVAAVVGIGPTAAGQATERVFDTVDVDRVLVLGVAGAIDPALRVGDVFWPDRVVDRASGTVFRPHRVGGVGMLVTSNAIGGELNADQGGAGDPATTAGGSDADADADVRAGAGDPAVPVASPAAELPPETSAVDMETAAIAGVCEARGVAWSVVRTISDVPGTLDDSVLELVRPDGGLDPLAVARLLVRNPSRARLLVQIARDTQRAVQALRRAALLEL